MIREDKAKIQMMTEKENKNKIIEKIVIEVVMIDTKKLEEVQIERIRIEGVEIVKGIKGEPKI